MGIQSKIKAVARLAVRPAALSAILRDLRRRPGVSGDDSEHLAAVMRWLCQAQDVTRVGGVAIGWFLKDGWQKPYPETTGYIIPTFLAYGRVNRQQEYLDRAIRMGAWELSIQADSGAIPGRPGTGEHPLVFDTAQVMKGWIALYRETRETRWLDAAVRAATWIASLQSADGSWIRGSHKSIPHAYYTYVAWPLCEVAEVTGDQRFLTAAAQHVRWVLSLRDKNGWISRMAFSENADPLTHTVAYTYEGLLECAPFLPKDQTAEVLDCVRQAMCRLRDSQGEADRNVPCRGRALPAFVQPSWRFVGGFSCLVGNVQFALIWLKLHRQLANEHLFAAAVAQIDEVKRRQDLATNDADIRGAVPGASPFWAGYGSLGYPNWAAKFLADALMLKTAIADSEPARPKLGSQNAALPR